MVIKKLLLPVILCCLKMSGQDSLAIAETNQYYERFFVTDVKDISPSGRHMVLLNRNQYGKEDFKLVNTITQTTASISKGSSYHFLNDDQLLIKSYDKVCFMHLKTKKLSAVKGNFVIRLVNLWQEVLLFTQKDKRLSKYSADGSKVWERSDVERYELDRDETTAVSFGGEKVTKTDLSTGKSVSVPVNGNIKALQISTRHIVGFHPTEQSIDLHIWDKSLNHHQVQRLDIPEHLVFAKGRMKQLELKNETYIWVPLEAVKQRNTKLPAAAPSISYTTKRDPYSASSGAGIYNIKSHEWQWLPAQSVESDIQIPLNQKGDFILASPDDVSGTETRPLFSIRLILNYGLQQYDVGKGRTDRRNFHWDERSRTLLFFKNRQWWYYKPAAKQSGLLFAETVQPMVNDRYNGLTDLPVDKVIATNESSKVILSGSHDLFLCDLATLKIKQLTQGFENHMEYRVFQVKSNSTVDEIDHALDLEKGILVRMQDQWNYHSGFALIQKDIKTLVYGAENYKFLMGKGKLLFAISHFYQQPLKVTAIGNSKPHVIFDNRLFTNDKQEDLKLKLLQYHTALGSASAALLYPTNYDPDKKYPMVVNIYENKTRDLLYYSVPDLVASDGFNMMHYVNQGYFVLLPELQYEIGNVPQRMIASLEGSVKKAFSEANIDRDNVGVIGMSFGGYEAGLALSNSKLFKTGSIGVMMSDLVSMSLSQAPILLEPNFDRIENDQISMNVSLFDDWQRYRIQSPVYHLPNVTVPALLWTGSLDDNVSPAQTKEYFFGLKRLRKKAVMLEYPLDGHAMISKESRQDLSVRIWQWMEHFLKGRPAADWIAPL